MSQYETDYGRDSQDDYQGRTATTVTAGHGGSRGVTPVVTFENVSKH